MLQTTINDKNKDFNFERVPVAQDTPLGKGLTLLQEIQLAFSKAYKKGCCHNGFQCTALFISM